jgi:hypothetical protein
MRESSGKLNCHCAATAIADCTEMVQVNEQGTTVRQLKGYKTWIWPHGFLAYLRPRRKGDGSLAPVVREVAAAFRGHTASAGAAREDCQIPSGVQNAGRVMRQPTRLANTHVNKKPLRPPKRSQGSRVSDGAHDTTGSSRRGDDFSKTLTVDAGPQAGHNIGREKTETPRCRGAAGPNEPSKITDFLQAAATR